jgi:hypothetical protein
MKKRKVGKRARRVYDAFNNRRKNLYFGEKAIIYALGYFVVFALVLLAGCYRIKYRIRRLCVKGK